MNSPVFFLFSSPFDRAPPSSREALQDAHVYSREWMSLAAGQTAHVVRTAYV